MGVMSGKSDSVANLKKKPNEAVYDGAAMNSLFGDDEIAPKGKAAPKDKLADPLMSVGAALFKAKDEGASSGGPSSVV